MENQTISLMFQCVCLSNALQFQQKYIKLKPTKETLQFQQKYKKSTLFQLKNIKSTKTNTIRKKQQNKYFVPAGQIKCFFFRKKQQQ